MKLESRITERFKYKLINKYSLLLQALITYQEREMETITHLQTKRKIQNALHQFVKAEAEAAAKAVIGSNNVDIIGCLCLKNHFENHLIITWS